MTSDTYTSPEDDWDFFGALTLSFTTVNLFTAGGSGVTDTGDVILAIYERLLCSIFSKELFTLFKTSADISVVGVTVVAAVIVVAKLVVTVVATVEATEVEVLFSLSFSGGLLLVISFSFTS